MIKLEKVNKIFASKTSKTHAVKDVSLTIDDGDIFGIIGYSGAGKSTLVRCINFLEIPTSGTITIDDKEIKSINEKLYFIKGDKQVKLKNKDLLNIRKNIGMIFQHFNLLDRLNVYDNVAYPLKYSKMPKKDIDKKVKELLALVGLSDKIDAFPSELSGGQRQRVAIARSLANDPKILLSDEATSALDPDVTSSILQLLKDLNKKLGLTIIIITHEMDVVKSICNKVAVMDKGVIEETSSVYDLFANPISQTTKKFTTQKAGETENISLKDNQMFVKLIFRNNSVNEAIISTIAKEYEVAVNIRTANIEFLQDMPLGNMTAILEGNSININNAIAYLEKNNIEVIKNNGGSSNE